MPITEEIIKAGYLNPSTGLLELDRLDCEDSLATFVRGAWKNVDPAPYIHGWHLEAISEHLQAVAWGHIKRLIINVPPRSSKSTITSVCFPAWVWAQRDILPLSGPQVQLLSASYATTLANRDSLKARRLISSAWYQERWGDRFSMLREQDAKWRYDNDKGGYRLATSVDGAVTGEGGNIIIIDDAHNAKEAQSKASRQTVLEWWDTSMSTRLNNPNTDAFIVIMQRLHEDDLTGHILTNSDEDWTHLMLPMEFESDRHCHTVLTWDEDGEPDVKWSDPRSIEGQLLLPSRMGTQAVEKLKRALGPYNAAGQLQQRPEPKGGGIFKREWWQPWGDLDDEMNPMFRKYPPFDFIIASIDTAYSEKQENDYSAMTIWGVWSGRSHPIAPTVVNQLGEREQGRFASHIDAPKVMLCMSWAERLAFPHLVEKTIETCRRFKVDLVLIESKASGMSLAQELRIMHGREKWSVQTVDPGNIDKVARAHTVAAMFYEGMIYAPMPGGVPKEWAEKVIANMSTFPKAAHDDLTDSAVHALRYLRETGFVMRVSEIEEEIEESVAYRNKSTPLYPGSR